MVNPTVNAALPQTISLSALLGGSSINSTQTNTQDLTPFKDLITNLMNNELAKDRVQLAVDTASNDKVKAALYQAASVLHMMGSIQNVAAMDLQNIAKDPAVANIIQENNLTAPEKQLFLKGLKLTAIEITTNENSASAAPAGGAQSAPAAASDTAQAAAPVNVPAANSQFSDMTTNITTSNIPVTNAPVSGTQSANTPVAAAPVINTPAAKAPVINTQPLQVLAGTLTSTVSVPQAALMSVNAPQAAPLQTAPVLNVAPVTAAPATVSGGSITHAPAATAPVSGGQVIPVLGQGTSQAAVNSTSSVVQAAASDISSEMDQLNTLILILQDILAGIISNHFDQVKSDTQAKAEGKIAASALDKAKAQLEDLKAALSAEKSSPADQAKIEQAEKDLLASLNTVIAAVQTMTAAVAAQSAIPAQQSEDSAGASNIKPAVTALNTSTQDNGRTKQYTLITGSDTDNFDALMNKIVTLLNDMNGKLEISEQLAYIPIAALQTPVQEASAQQTPAQQISTPQTLTSSTNAPAVTLNETKPEVVLANTVETPQAQNTLVIQQQASGKAQIVVVPVANRAADNGANLVVKNVTVESTVEPITSQAVTFTGGEVSVKPAAYDSQGRNLVKDIQWVSDNIIKPAVKDADTINALSTTSEKSQIFSKAADFALNIKDQVILRQVTSGIQDAPVQAVKINQISMVLRPENLGYVYIKIEHTGDKLRADIQVSNNDVKDALKSNLPALRDALSSIGLKLDNFDISTVNHNSNSSFNGQAKNPFQEWQGAAVQAPSADIESGIDQYGSAEGYLNYLA